MGSWKKIGFLSTALLVGAMALPAFGQAAPGDNGGGGGGAAGGGGGGAAGGGGGRGGRGNRGGGAGGQAGGAGGGGGFGQGGGFQQFQQQQTDALKKSLGVTDDEMAALQPKIDAVTKAQNDLRGGFGGMADRARGNRGGPGGAAAAPGADPAAAAPAAPALSPLAQARKDLQDILNKADASADEIKAKLDAFRAAKKTAQDDLVKAQGDLKSLLTQKQEAVFVLRGTLD